MGLFCLSHISRKTLQIDRKTSGKTNDFRAAEQTKIGKTNKDWLHYWGFSFNYVGLEGKKIRKIKIIKLRFSFNYVGLEGELGHNRVSITRVSHPTM